VLGVSGSDAGITGGADIGSGVIVTGFLITRFFATAFFGAALTAFLTAFDLTAFTLTDFDLAFALVFAFVLGFDFVFATTCLLVFLATPFFAAVFLAFATGRFFDLLFFAMITHLLEIVRTRSESSPEKVRCHLCMMLESVTRIQ
jgi:hypothetical protein